MGGCPHVLRNVGGGAPYGAQYGASYVALYGAPYGAACGASYGAPYGAPCQAPYEASYKLTDGVQIGEGNRIETAMYLYICTNICVWHCLFG